MNDDLKSRKYKRIFLIDYRDDGHRMMYLLHFTKVLLLNNYKVVVFCPQPERVLQFVPAEYRQNLKAVSFTYPKRKPRDRSPKTIFKLWLYLFQKTMRLIFIEGLKPDLCFFMCLDNWLMESSRFAFYTNIIRQSFPYKWSGILLHPSKYRSIDSELKQLKAQKCAGICILDEFEFSSLSREINKKIILIPDFTDTRISESKGILMKSLLKVSNNKIKLGLLGSIGKWKGLIEFLNLAQKLQEEGKSEFFFVIIGELYEQSFSKAELDFIHHQMKELKNTFCHLRRIEAEEDYNQFFNYMDIIFLAYQNFPHSSNSLTKAAYFCKPVLAQKGNCVGKRVEQFKLGKTISSLQSEEVYENLVSHDWKKENLDGCLQYYQKHSLERLTEVIQTDFSKLWE